MTDYGATKQLCPMCGDWDGIITTGSELAYCPVCKKYPPCQVPPEGWDCTRGAGHEGPCAAVPTLDKPRAASDYARLFGRGFLIVCLTAMNVRQISAGNYAHAFVVGCGISLVWWFNSRSANRTDLPLAGWVYALGAGVGTVTGMALTR